MNSIGEEEKKLDDRIDFVKPLKYTNLLVKIQKKTESVIANDAAH